MLGLFLFGKLPFTESPEWTLAVQALPKPVRKPRIGRMGILSIAARGVTEKPPKDLVSSSKSRVWLEESHRYHVSWFVSFLAVSEF